MHRDVLDLNSFYESRLGQVALRLIRRRIRLMWPDVSGLRVMGLGFATPFLRAYRWEAERLIAAMPAAQGCLAWPPDEVNVTVLLEEDALPLPDNSIDRVLIVHGLEMADRRAAMIRELWRVMASSGRLIAVVPNRTGLWARTEATPFGSGQPYSAGQLARFLRASMFTPERSDTALFVPPSNSRMVLRTARAWEDAGRSCLPSLSGVNLIEASKETIITPGLLEAEPAANAAVVPIRNRPAVARPAAARAAANGLRAVRRRDG